jgi:hypothetical protein
MLLILLLLMLLMLVSKLPRLPVGGVWLRVVKVFLIERPNPICTRLRVFCIHKLIGWKGAESYRKPACIELWNAEASLTLLLLMIIG